MPQFTHDEDDVPGPANFVRVAAVTSGIAAHLARIDTHLGKVAIVDPGPPHDDPIIANVRSIAASAAHIQAIANEWLNRPNGQPGNIP